MPVGPQQHRRPRLGSCVCQVRFSPRRIPPQRAPWAQGLQQQVVTDFLQCQPGIDLARASV
eukprot:7774867-Lingulodinium_polyedra.AAC.1